MEVIFVLSRFVWGVKLKNLKKLFLFFFLAGGGGGGASKHLLSAAKPPLPSQVINDQSLRPFALTQARL